MQAFIKVAIFLMIVIAFVSGANYDDEQQWVGKTVYVERASKNDRCGQLKCQQGKCTKYDIECEYTYKENGNHKQLYYIQRTRQQTWYEVYTDKCENKALSHLQVSTLEDNSLLTFTESGEVSLEFCGTWKKNKSADELEDLEALCDTSYKPLNYTNLQKGC